MRGAIPLAMVPPTAAPPPAPTLAQNSRSGCTGPMKPRALVSSNGKIEASFGIPGSHVGGHVTGKGGCVSGQWCKIWREVLGGHENAHA